MTTPLSDADLKQIWARWEKGIETAADIEAAGDDIPHLLAEVERLRTENDDMRETVAYSPVTEALFWNLAERAVGKQRANARLVTLLRRWVEWQHGSVWECSQCGYIAIPSPEDWSEFTRALLADTLAGLEASDGG